MPEKKKISPIDSLFSPSVRAQHWNPPTFSHIPLIRPAPCLVSLQQYVLEPFIDFGSWTKWCTTWKVLQTDCVHGLTQCKQKRRCSFVFWELLIRQIFLAAADTLIAASTRTCRETRCYWSSDWCSTVCGNSSPSIPTDQDTPVVHKLFLSSLAIASKHQWTLFKSFSTEHLLLILSSDSSVLSVR